MTKPSDNPPKVQMSSVSVHGNTSCEPVGLLSKDNTQLWRNIRSTETAMSNAALTTCSTQSNITTDQSFLCLDSIVSDVFKRTHSRQQITAITALEEGENKLNNGMNSLLGGSKILGECSVGRVSTNYKESIEEVSAGRPVIVATQTNASNKVVPVFKSRAQVPQSLCASVQQTPVQGAEQLVRPQFKSNVKPLQKTTMIVSCCKYISS